MKICEKCGIEHYGKYGSGRFCGKLCARSFSTFSNRKEINDKVSKKLRKYFDLGQCKWCGIVPEKKYGKGIFCSYPCKQSYVVSKINRTSPNYGFRNKETWDKTQKTRDEKLAFKYQQMNFENLPISEIKRKLYVKFNNSCGECKLQNWKDKYIILELHHIDGNNSNNKEENLIMRKW